ncbi:MAG: hypothetical protein KDB18_13915, partial [Salinibacterium sp.]|nr:hypothetical protein [Salinibacterium sp.]
VKTDRDVYLIGEEIPMRVRLRTLEPLPEGVALEAIAVVDGETLLRLPLDWTLPTEAGSELSTEIPMKVGLEAAGLYRRGLLTFDVHVRPRESRPGLGGSAPANRWTIQISENAEKLKTPMPAPVNQKPKPKPKPEREPDPERRPNEEEKKDPEKPEIPRPGEQPGPPPPADISDVPFVIDPLFSGNETKEREIDVFDRDPVDAENPPPPQSRPRPKARSYEPLRLADIESLPLPARERGIVRRYLESITEPGVKR